MKENKNLKELAELAWNGAIDLQFDNHPVHTSYEGATEINENLLAMKGIGGF